MKKLIYLFGISFLMLQSCSSDDNSASNDSNLKVGDFFQGGYIAYFFKQNEPGYIEGKQHGIISASIDQGEYKWTLCGKLFGTSTELGSGKENTFSMTNGCWGPNETTAAWVCSDLDKNGYSDWILPSRADMEKVYNNLHLNGVGNFSSGVYWTSSEYDTYNAYGYRFANGGGDIKVSKTTIKLFVRAIRYF
jgi:hypothetical protein